MAYSRDDEERILVAWATNPGCHARWRLRTTDFSAPASRFVFDVVGKFSERHGMLPDVGTVAKEIELAMTGDSQFTYVTKPDQSVMPAVGDLLSRMAQGLSESETVQVGDMVQPFLEAVRIGQVARLASESGWAPGKTVEAMQEVHSEVKSVMGVDPSDELSSGCDADDEALEHPEPRIGTGLRWLDEGLSGGLERENVAILIAPSGVGKTVGMINFCAHANECGLYTLFMTLENPKAMIRKRWQSIMGHYSIGNYSQPLSSWKEGDRARYKALTSKDCVYRDRFAILDKSGCRMMTVDTIERAIIAWKRQYAAMGVPEDLMAVVCIDWLKYIDTSATPGVNKNTRPDELLSFTIRALGGVAKRQRVVIWTAQQVKSKAQHKEVLGPEDISDAVGIQDYLDLGIGLARKSDDMGRTAVTMDGSSSKGRGETDRALVISCFKARESSIADGSRETIYQGKSLRMWDSKEQCMKMTARIEKEDPVAHYCGGR